MRREACFTIEEGFVMRTLCARHFLHICKKGKLDEGMKLFHEMSNRNICPDVVTYSALIDGLCKEGKLHEASKLLHDGRFSV